MGTSDLISTWGSTKNSIEAMASFLNSFPMFKDDTRNTHPKFVANATYNFSSGESKSRSNINLTLNAKRSGETSYFLQARHLFLIWQMKSWCFCPCRNVTGSTIPR